MTNQVDPRFAPPCEETSRQLRALIEICRAFREISPTMPVTYVQAFLTVCLKPGNGSTEYQKELETIQPIMSRILLSLGNKQRRKPADESGFKLIDFAHDPIDLRLKRVFLTPGGKQLLNKVLREVERM